MLLFCVHAYICMWLYAFLYFALCTCMYTCVGICFPWHPYGGRGQLARISSLSTMWVMGTALGLSGLYLYLLSYLIGPPCFLRQGPSLACSPPSRLVWLRHQVPESCLFPFPQLLQGTFMQVRENDQQACAPAFSPAPGGSCGSCPSERGTETALELSLMGSWEQMG